MGKKGREQEGIIHVYFRANGRYTVFYDDEDNLELLRRMDKFARKYNSQILEFALMGNHAHFLINTNSVTLLMKETLQSYSRWYNKKYKNSNKVFKTPFSSACKRSDEWVLYTSLYILQNPIKAGICSKIENYRWSSATMHFIDDKKYIPIGYQQYLNLCGAVSVDTSLVDGYFKDYKEFLKYMNNNPLVKNNINSANSKWEYTTTEQLIGEVNKLLGGRILNQLSRNDMKELILTLHSSVKCKMLQIASVLHVDYKFVKDCIKEAPQPE